MMNNVLHIHIEEPTSDPSTKYKHLLLADSPPEAEKRYRSIIAVLISQLTGLSQTNLKFIITPSDPGAIEAVTFWLLPLFQGHISKKQKHFLFTPKQSAPPFTIEFTTHQSPPSHNIEKAATLSAHCPQCSSRWINAAMTQCNKETQVIGTKYLTIKHLKNKPNSKSILLPDLPCIHTHNDWIAALKSPIGSKLIKQYQKL